SCTKSDWLCNTGGFLKAGTGRMLVPRLNDQPLTGPGMTVWRILGRSQQSEIPDQQLAMKEQRNDGTEREEGAEWDRILPFDDSETHQADADNRPDDRPEHDGNQGRFPSEESAHHGHQLDVAQAHTF